MYNIDMHRFSLLKLFSLIFAALLAMSSVAADNPCSVNPISAECVESIRLAAEQGDADAQNLLGLRYLDGYGVKQDYQEGERWLREAAAHGNADAQHNLDAMGLFETDDKSKTNYSVAGRVLIKGLTSSTVLPPKSFAKPLSWIAAGIALPVLLLIVKGFLSKWLLSKKSSPTGTRNSQAINFIDASIEDIREAAEQGQANAQYFLGSRYELGNSVEVDCRQAAQWYRKAAMQGEICAQLNLAIMYYQGDGISKDEREAYIWFLILKKGKYESAKGNLQKLSEALTPEEIQSAENEATQRMAEIENRKKS